MARFSKILFDGTDMSKIPPRPERSHKGTFGKVLCVCGSVGMAGASYFSALAAYRTGAGLVEIFAPEENRTILQTLIPEAVLRIYDSSSPDIEYLKEVMKECDSIVVGCGLGKSSSALLLLKTVLKNTSVPTVIDADALNMIAEHPFLLKYARGHIITPHMKEMSRLTGIAVGDILNDPADIAYDFAKKHGLVCVLKDHHTVISDGGEDLYLNQSGNSGMATGGSGDLLTGVIAALLAQSKGSLSCLDASVLGVYIHGKAGDVAAEKLGQYAVMATDIANEIRI